MPLQRLNSHKHVGEPGNGNVVDLHPHPTLLPKLLSKLLPNLLPKLLPKLLPRLRPMLFQCPKLLPCLRLPELRRLAVQQFNRISNMTTFYVRCVVQWRGNSSCTAALAIEISRHGSSVSETLPLYSGGL